MNNYEKIKNMSIDEMAEFFIKNYKNDCIFIPDIYCNPYNINDCTSCIVKNIKQWLQEESEDENEKDL